MLIRLEIGCVKRGGFLGNRVASKFGLSNNGVIMSVSTLQTENSWHGVHTLESVPIEATVPALSASLSTLEQSENRKGNIAFRSRLEIPGVRLIPEQDCTATRTEFGLILQNNPRDSWPRFSINTVSNSAQISVWPSVNTVDGELLNTRVRFALEKAGLCSLYPRDIGVEFKLVFKHPSESEKQKLLYRAKLCRKLKYIEQAFGTSFLLPDEIPAEQVEIIDRVFRGITEGEFTTRAPRILFDAVSLSSFDLSRPPFTGPGPLSRETGREQRLFDRLLPVGPVSVHLERATLANPRVLDREGKDPNQLVSIRFELLDNQITHRFESYAMQSRKQRIERLDQFKRDLAREEPKELVDLVDEPLQGDVSELEADQIAVGWTFYNRLSDRFCPQDPEIDRSTGHWRVPIWLVYANGEGGPVGDLLIHKKSGVVLSHTPMEELRSKAMALADTILHAG